MHLRAAFASLTALLAACGESPSSPAETASDAALAVPDVGGPEADGGRLPEPDAAAPDAAPPAPLPLIEGAVPFTDLDPDPRTLEVELVARDTELPLLPGAPTRLSTYNGTLPGPLLQARVGDRVIVHFTNALADPTVVHWHGLRISDEMDGSPRIQDPVLPGESFTYDFVLPDAGTFWYHTHLSQIEQLERGLYGPIVVHEAEPPAFTAERIFVVDDIRLGPDHQIAAFQTSGHDIGRGRVGNTILVNGQAEPASLVLAHGAVERWRVVLSTNALSVGLRVRGADVRVIGTDGGLLPEPFPLDRVEMAPGQRYDLEVRPQADARTVVLQAMIPTLNERDEVVDAPTPLVQANVRGDVTASEPVYPAVDLPATPDAAPLEDWQLSGGVVDGEVRFTINGQWGGGEDHAHALLGTFEPNVPVRIRIQSDVSPEHPFHLHGQFFQIVARDDQPVFEPGLRDTVQIRGDESATILTYFENPGRWMVHCHINEHGENGMMAEVQVGASAHAGH